VFATKIQAVCPNMEKAGYSVTVETKLAPVEQTAVESNIN
jgi:hypothetical protein